ncbi:hypothetical protein CEP53_014897, partial [Fusarium sp. AF-6]
MEPQAHLSLAIGVPDCIRPTGIPHVEKPLCLHPDCLESTWSTTKTPDIKTRIEEQVRILGRPTGTTLEARFQRPDASFAGVKAAKGAKLRIEGGLNARRFRVGTRNRRHGYHYLETKRWPSTGKHPKLDLTGHLRTQPQALTRRYFRERSVHYFQRALAGFERRE